jgi:hypothetical protein
MAVLGSHLDHDMGLTVAIYQAAPAMRPRGSRLGETSPMNSASRRSCLPNGDSTPANMARAVQRAMAAQNENPPVGQRRRWPPGDMGENESLTP